MTEPHVDPTRAQFDAFKALPRDQPIEMLKVYFVKKIEL